MKCLLLVFAMLIGLVANAGTEVRNGGGTAEQNVIFAYLNLELYTSNCLNSSRCGLDPNEKALLTEIRNALPRERETKNQLQFISGSERPGFFTVNGKERAAVTGANVGDIIYINLDFLYTLNEADQLTAMDIGTATGILVHEMGHHAGISDEISLDLLGAKVNTFLNQRTETAYWSDSFSDRFQIKATNISFENFDRVSSQLIFESTNFFGESYIIDASPSVQVLLDASAICLNRGGKFAGFLLRNIHWSRKAAKYGIQAGGKLYSQLTIACRIDTANVEYENRYDLAIIVPTPSFFDRDHEAPKPLVQLIDCEANKRACH